MTGLPTRAEVEGAVFLSSPAGRAQVADCLKHPLTKKGAVTTVLMKNGFAPGPVVAGRIYEIFEDGMEGGER